MDSFKEIDFMTPGGKFIGRTPAFTPNHALFSRTLTRYLKGLYWHEYRRRVPDNAVMKLNYNVEEIVHNEDEFIFKFFGPHGLKIVQDKVFAYSHLRQRDDRCDSGWCLIFYDVFPILGVVMSAESVAENPGRAHLLS